MFVLHHCCDKMFISNPCRQLEMGFLCFPHCVVVGRKQQNDDLMVEICALSFNLNINTSITAISPEEDSFEFIQLFSSGHQVQLLQTKRGRQCNQIRLLIEVAVCDSFFYLVHRSNLVVFQSRERNERKCIFDYVFDHI